MPVKKSRQTQITIDQMLINLQFDAKRVELTPEYSNRQYELTHDLISPRALRSLEKKYGFDSLENDFGVRPTLLDKAKQTVYSDWMSTLKTYYAPVKNAGIHIPNCEDLGEMLSWNSKKEIFLIDVIENEEEIADQIGQCQASLTKSLKKLQKERSVMFLSNPKGLR